MKKQQCSCGSAWLASAFDRRRFLRITAGGLAVAAFTPWSARAASGKYEAMVLACIDPRFQEPVDRYTAERHLTGQYSQFTFAGAAIGVVAPAFEAWHRTFWDNLEASIQLHGIDKVIAIDHRDCGAAKIAYGEAAVANYDAETKTHRAVFAEFRAQVAARHPRLTVETGLMALDGTFEAILA